MQRSLYRAVIFDCDGVIVDTEGISNLVWRTKLAEYGLHLSLSELEHYFTGFTTLANLHKAEELLGSQLPENFLEQVRQLFWENINHELPVIPGIEPALKSIKLPKAAATNAQRKELDFKLEKTGLAHYFLHTVCCEDVPAPKPAPDVYLEAAKRLGFPAHCCAVVEDSSAGTKAGVAAGMTVFGYCKDADPETLRLAGADCCFNEMKDLPELLSC